jgi:hypothetical protein
MLMTVAEITSEVEVVVKIEEVVILALLVVAYVGYGAKYKEQLFENFFH